MSWGTFRANVVVVIVGAGGVCVGGCGGDTRTGADTAVALEDTGVAPEGTGEGSHGATDAGAHTPSSEGSGGAGTGSSGLSSGTGTDDTGGEPPHEVRPCDHALGCHMPAAPRLSRGLQSHTPIGCEGEQFRPTAAINLNTLARSDAARAVPIVTDVNGDEVPDLIINPRKGMGMILEGDGTGDFSPTPAALLQGGFAFAGGWGGDVVDIDNDGVLDIVMGDHTRGALAWMGRGGFSFENNHEGLPPALYSGAGAADLDGDKRAEVIFGADQFATGIHIASWDGTQWNGVTAPSVAGGNIGTVVFGDYDGDGDDDPVVFGSGQYQGRSGLVAFVLENDLGGTGELSVAALKGAHVSGGAGAGGQLGDLDCDGDLDLVIGGGVYIADAPGRWRDEAVGVVNASASHLADMNGDGHLDLIVNSVAAGLRVYLNDGTGMDWEQVTWAGLPDESYAQYGETMDVAYGLDVADLDGNGRLDIVRIGGFGEEPDGFGSTARRVLIEAWTW